MTTGYRLDVPWPFAYVTAATQRTGATLKVYENNTTTLVSLYSDRACLVAAANPIVSVAGYFPVRFVAAAALHTLLWEDTDGTDRLSANDISPYQDSQQANSANQTLDATLTAFAALTISSNKLAYGTGSDTFATTDFTAAARTLLDDSTVSAMLTTLGLGDFATTAQIWANTANKVVGTDELWASMDPVAISYSATTTFDLSTFINGEITLTGNVTFGAPSNAKVGQSGCIEIVQDGTGSRVATWNAAFVWANGVDGVLTTTASARDLLFYQVLNSGAFYSTLVKAIA